MSPRKTAAAKQVTAAKRKRASRPIFFEVMRVVLLETGEEVGALVPLTKWDRRSMRERKFTIGSEWRGDLKRARNPGFYRKAHVLGAWLADHVEGFEGLSQHDALKRLQELSGIGCTLESFHADMPGGGSLEFKRAVAESLNFEDMDEGRWCELWDGGTGEGGWLGWLRREKWGALSADQVEDVEALIRKPEEGC